MSIKIRVGGSAKPAKRDLLYSTGATKKTAKAVAKLNISSLQAQFDATANKAKQDILMAAFTPTLQTAKLAENITLDTSQQNAVDNLINQQFGCLIGSAGTGKTTTINAFLKRLEEKSCGEEFDLQIAFCAPTGRAAQQIKRALPKKYHTVCGTAHALLEFKPVYTEVIDPVTNELKNTMRFVPTFNGLNKLSCKVLIIDEAGSVSITLWKQLYAALTSDCIVIKLGDLGQLPPPVGHAILGFAMLKWPTYELTTLHRNAGEIAIQSHRVLQGFKPITDPSEKAKTVIIKKISDGSIGAKKELLATIRYLHDNGKFDPMQDAIIVPMNVGEVGQTELNNILVNQFNPQKPDKSNPRTAIKTSRETKVFAVGDKIMLLKNNTQTGLTNGMQGVITNIQQNAAFAGNIHIMPDASKMANIDLNSFSRHLASLSIKDKDDKEPATEAERAASHIITVRFQDKTSSVTFSTSGELTNLTLSYAITCHKAQGSEFRSVIVFCHSVNLRMLCREWLYTAMTRAKTQLLLLCNNRGLSHAVGTQRIKGDTIKEKAEKFIALQTVLKTKDKPVLPEPKTILHVGGNIKFKSENKDGN